MVTEGGPNHSGKAMGNCLVEDDLMTAEGSPENLKWAVEHCPYRVI